MTYSRAVAWNYGNKEEASVTLTETVDGGGDYQVITGYLQGLAKELVIGLLRESGVQLVREQAQ